MSGMDPSLAPINGISLERYAELGADVTDHMNDPDAVARIVESKGVSRADWDAASKGWTARMQDPANMGRIATMYMPLYQAALARKKGNVDVGFEDYVALSGARKALGQQRFNATYNIDDATWYQIAGAWNQKIPTDPRYMMYGTQVEQEAARIAQGGAPKPVAITRTAGGGGAAPAAAGAGATPGFVGSAPTPGFVGSAPNPYDAQAQQNAMMAQAVQAQVAAAQAQANAQAAAAYGNAAANMGFLGKGMLGVMGYGAIASGIGPGMRVLVQWSDGQRYPAQCMQVANGQVMVAFPDGRQLWVPESAVSRQ
jgi:hypothetical protein